jgi:alpha-ketoglutarate-dependent taurine dioxygenase
VVEIRPTGKVLGAAVLGADLSKPLNAKDFGVILGALGRHGVICIPGQKLEAASLKDFAGRFGELEINVAGTFQDPVHPEVMILSNIKEDGKPIGLADAGQDWHTDMSYSSTIAFANVLYAIKVPRRNGKALGSTEFASMHAAYDDLPAAIKARLDGKTVLHDFAKFWDKMRAQPGSTRKPLTEEQRRKKPPVSHPVFLTHPITGAKVLYCNPGYAMRINELPQDESDELLAFLFRHQLQPKYCHVHEWTEGDVLMWDNIGTLHQAWPDYTADEHRLIKRCQVMADKVFDPNFARQAVMM